MVRHPEYLARAGTAALVDRDRRAARGDGRLHPAGFLRDELLHLAGQALLRPFGRQQN